MIDQRRSLGKRLSAWEKHRFPWRKDRLVKDRPAFFPGCNLINFLPETGRSVVRVFEAAGDGWIYDCCGKPLQGMGMKAEASAVLTRVDRRLSQAGVSELVVACPNCLPVFEAGLSLPVSDIYTYLKRRGIPCRTAPGERQVFPPCPDRREGRIRRAAEAWTQLALTPSRGLPCCGLGISDAAAAEAARQKAATGAAGLSPYCASCCGHLHRSGAKLAPHLLTEGLGLGETPALGMRLALNRMKPLGW